MLFPNIVCHKKIKIETKNDCLRKTILKAFHNIEHEPFKISMEIFLPIDFAYIVYAHCMCTKRDLLKSQGNNCLPLKIRNSPKTELIECEVCKGFTFALLSQMSLCDCCSCESPTTFKTINSTVNHSQN